MVINRTRWAPDTCDCELEYEWDTDEPEDRRVHNFSKVIKACEAHNRIVPPNTTAQEQLKRIYDTVLEENQRKNQALGRALETRPELADIIDGRTNRRYDASFVAKQLKVENHVKASELLNHGLTLKEDIDYKWRWVEPKGSPKAPRTLEIDFDIPLTVERAIAAETTDPTVVKQRVLGLGLDMLQQVLDSEFNESKGRGKVKVVKTG
jgi:hypothetical protein